MSSEGTTHYHQKVVFCGKARCKKCREGTGHGPYWYVSERAVGGKTTRTYLGTQQQATAHILEQIDRSLAQQELPTTIALLDQLLAVDPTHDAFLQRLMALLIGVMKHAAPLHPAGRTHRSSLVGRHREQERLQTVLHHPGDLPCLLITGEAGLGKTRLAEELAVKALDEGWNVVWGRTHAQESRFPYALWSEVLRQLLPSHTAGSFLPLLRRFPARFEPLGILLPSIEECFGRPPGSHALEHYRLWEAIGDLLVLMSQQAPLLVVLDDLQWADSSSCELLAYVARRFHGHAALLVGTCRVHELLPNHTLQTLLADLQREQMAECLALAPLNDEQMQLLLADLHVPQPLVPGIQSRAAGNPFFAEELARALDQGDPAGTHLPDTITAVLDLRLSRLSPACQRFLSQAAVLGDTFAFDLISAMEAGFSTDPPMLDLLEEALRSGVLTEHTTDAQITYAFWHPLLAKRLYEQLSAARRSGLHRRAAAALQDLYHEHEEEAAAMITHHLVAGGAAPHRITQYAVMAGDRAHALSAYADALHQYQLAVQQLETADTSPDDRLARLWICLAECLRIMGRPLEARVYYERALTIQPAATPREAQIYALLSCELGLTWYDTQDLEQALSSYAHGEQCLRTAQVRSGPAWARLRYEQSYVQWRAGRYDEAQRLAHDALALFTELPVYDTQAGPGNEVPASSRISRNLAGDPVDLGRTHQLLGLIANGTGQATEARLHLEEAFRIFERHRCRRELAILCCNLGDMYLRLAEYDQAQTMLQRCLQNAQEIGDLPLVTFAWGNLGLLNVHHGRLQEAESCCRQAVEAATQREDVVASTLWRAYIAQVLTEQGRLSEASIELAGALQQVRAVRLPPYSGRMLSVVARLRLAQVEKDVASDERRPDRRAQFLRRARNAVLHALKQEGLETEVTIECRLYLAQVNLQEGNLEVASQQAHSALTLAQQSEGKGLQACAQGLIGSILAAQGQDSQAAHAFEIAIAMCERLGMRLEHARVSLSYGQFLLQRKKNLQRCVILLQDAQQTLSVCKAAQTERYSEQLLATAALLLL